MYLLRIYIYIYIKKIILHFSGSNFYKRKHNVESEAFRQIFPQTPLIGIFGQGEIGLTYLPNEKSIDTFSDPSASKRRKLQEEERFSHQEFSHSFTTVFVMISFLK